MKAMFTYLMIIALVCLVVYLVSELLKAQSAIKTLTSQVSDQMVYASESYDLYEAWHNYALSLESENKTLRAEIIRIAPLAMDTLIRDGKVNAAKLSYNEGKKPNGDDRKESIYALALPGMESPSGYAPIFASDGAIIYESIPVAVKVETPKASSNGNSSNTAKSNGNGNKPSNGDHGSFEASSKVDPKDLFTSDKYGEYIDLLIKHLNVKTIPGNLYPHVKEMYKTWETGKKPNTAQEYAKRMIDSKFGGKAK